MIEEKIIVGEGTEWPLNGLITLPDGVVGAGTNSEPVPGVVLVHGSGPQDMNEKIYALTPFKDIAEALAVKGVATIRYDKRTRVYGRKMMKHPEEITVRTETIEDAILATNILKNDPRFGRVFILGHSMGGMLAPQIDAEGGDYDGIIIAAGIVRSLREVMKQQFEDLIPKYKGLVKIIAKKQAANINKSLEKLDSLSDEESKKVKAAGGARAYYFKDMEAHPPAMYLKDIAKPVFIFQGDKDFQVYPEVDFEQYRQLVGDKPNVTMKLYPGLNHCLTESHATGTTKDYKVPGKVAQCVTDDIADWITALK